MARTMTMTRATTMTTTIDRDCDQVSQIVMAVSQSCNVLCWKSMRNMLRLFWICFRKPDIINSKSVKIKTFSSSTCLLCRFFSKKKHPEQHYFSGGHRTVLKAWAENKREMLKLLQQFLVPVAFLPFFLTNLHSSRVVKDVKRWRRVVELSPSPSVTKLFVSQRELKDSNKC